MSVETRSLHGVTFRQMGTINPGEAIYFRAGSQICVETYALDWGQHDFNYEVNSRTTRGGAPQAIATTRRALQREFMERRVVTRQPIPISAGDTNGNRIPEVAMTMGEVSPLIYRSRLTSSPLAWSINFMSHRNVAAGGTVSAAGNAARRNSNAPAVARGSARMSAAPTGFNYLMLWIPASDINSFRFYDGGFGVTDMIGTEPSAWQRWSSWVTGR